MSNTIYLIVSCYGDSECYNVYGKGIYTDLDQSMKDWKKALKHFLMLGPDDLYNISLVECILTDKQLKELEKHLINLKKIDNYNHNTSFVNFMEKHIDMYEAIYGPEGYEACEEICEAIDAADKDMYDNKVFCRYFNKYYKEQYCMEE